MSFFLFYLLICLKLSLRLHYPTLSVNFGLYLVTYISGSLILSLPFLYINRLSTYLFGMACFLLTLFNHEHILINNGHLNLGFWKLGSSAVFLNSLFHKGLLINTLFLTTLFSVTSLISHWFCKRDFKILRRNLFLEFGILILLIDFFLPKDISVPGWQQNSFITGVIKNITSSKVEKLTSKNKLTTGITIDKNKVKSTPNIYVFVLEGFSQDYLDAGVAKNLKILQGKSLFFQNFIANQQQTNRGLYSLFCGDFPNLLNLEAKSDILISSIEKQKRNCFPSALKDLGYTNYFIQSAPLSFMNKADFTRAIGFDFAVGAEEYLTKEIISPWGVDDSTTFETVLNTAQTKPSPKLISSLTISTHYPYKTKVSEGNLLKAIHYTDQIVAQAVQKVLATDSNALIVITSDESRPLTPSMPLIRSNKGLFMVLSRSIKAGAIFQYYSLADFPYILETLLYKEEERLRIGRGRKIHFGNVYTNRIYSFDPKINKLITCNRRLDCVTNEKVVSPLDMRLGNFKRASKEEISQVEEFLSQNEWSFDKTLFSKENLKLRPRTTFNVFREFKYTPNKDFLEVTLNPQYEMKVTYTAYECGRPKTQKIEHYKATAPSTTLKLKFVNDRTQCLSLYLKSFNSQEVSKVEVQVRETSSD